jgi:hypothetical protein
MNLLELQQRANVLVEKANAYEDSLQGVTWNEQEIINQHKYTDIYSLRPIMKLLFGSTITEKTNRTLDNDVALRVFASTAPMWNSSFNLLSFKKDSQVLNHNPVTGNTYTYTLPTLNPGDIVECNIITTLTTGIGTDTSLEFDLVGPRLTYKIYNKTFYESDMNWTRQGTSQYVLQAGYKLKIYSYMKVISSDKMHRSGSISVYHSDGRFLQEYTVDQDFPYPIPTSIQINKSVSPCSTNPDDVTVIYKQSSQSVDYKSDQHEFMNDIHNYNNSNLITLDVKQNTLTDRESRIKQGINYSYSANIQDALVTESQVANVFKWNTTTSQDIKNNTITVSRQVPGIVCYYLGNDYNGEYTATIPYNPGTMKLNQINYSTPPSYGAFYTTDPTTSQVPVRQGVLAEDIGHEACRIFIPGMHFTRGKLESPQQIWQPDMKFGDSNIGLGYNWQGQALYHELVFKNRRSGSKKANVDFVPTLDTVADNDPQGLATRFALAQQKKYYKNRPWFNELDELVDLDPTRLQKIIENNSYITTSGGSFDKSKFTVATGGELDDNGILNDCSKKVTVTGLNIPLTDELTIFGPKITFEFDFTSNYQSPNLQFWAREGFDNSVRCGLSKGEAEFTSSMVEVISNTPSFLFNWTPSGTYQIKIIVKKINDQIKSTFQYINTSDNSIWKEDTIDNTPTNGSFTIQELWIANDSLRSGETSKVYDLSPIKIVDQDDTVLFSAQGEASKTYMTDEQFYNQFKLDYDMFTRAFNLPQ